MFYCGPHMSSKVLTRHTETFCTRISNSLALKLSLCGLLVFIDMNTLILYTESTNLKTFLEESYASAFDKCYIFTKNVLNKELKMMLILLMEFVYCLYEEIYLGRPGGIFSSFRFDKARRRS